MTIHTISYVSTEEGTCKQLSVEWTDGKYLARVAAYPVADVSDDLVRVVGKPRPAVVREKPAQRFRRDTFWRFADEMRGCWQNGDFED